ncbi:translocation/assembly module TamB domain-containing protein [Gilvimarinus sp. SDUM040013]|uniref:Translocation/assembly module TamB domain-containing protein n=1 Tax=Gilvimarinus gilvus TaxID=3058038 RepID=A0ABU4RX11_9GAMM|nr:translocation/assembly module TamB domain-containing protein [Gilvimarinus sp. SDUM040013]MDO3387863.1 translocation/assembly module TamB domain-containing protein [Gilvimarinus sp. SDUM040013]MDX6848766.1 translocation/assembly module TamB domain-containing protein [Gilvimarinus sp. SDUM040013]
MIKRVLVRALLVFSLVVMSLLLLISAVVATEPGTRWLLERVSAATNVELRYVEGALLRGVTLRDVRYQSAAVEFASEELELAWRPATFVWGVIYVDRLALDSVLVNVAQAESSAATAGEFTGWPDLDLPVRLTLKELVIAELTVKQGDAPELFIESVEASASYGVGEVSIERILIESAGDRLQLSGSGALSYPYDFNAKVAVRLLSRQDNVAPSVFSAFLPAAVLAESWSTGLKAKGNLEKIEFTLNNSQPLPVIVKGGLETGFNSTQAVLQPNVNASARIEEQSLPQVLMGIDVGPVQTLGAEVDFNGWLTGYDISVQAKTKIEPLDDLTLSLTASGDTERLTSAQLGLTMNKVRVGLNGKVSWRDGLRWSASVTGEDVDPSVLAKNWPGQIQFQLNSDGSWIDERLVASADVANLQGQLRALMIQGQGAVQYDNGSWQLKQVKTSLGANQVELNGSWGDSIDMTGVIAAPLLAQIDPKIGGELKASGNLRGTRQELRFNGDVDANNLRWQDYSVERFELQSSMERVVGRELAIKAIASGIDLAGKHVDKMSVSGGGKLNDHRFAFDIKAEDTSLHADVTGALSAEIWQGSILKFSVSSPYTHHIELEAPASAFLSPAKAELQTVCLHMPNDSDETNDVGVFARGCADVLWSVDDGLRSKFNIDRVDLALFDPWLKNGMKLGGYLQSDGELTWGKNEPKKLSASMHTVNAELVHQLSETDFNHYPLGELSANLEGDDKAVRVDSKIMIGEFGRAMASASYQMDSKQVSGQVNANIDNLKPLMALIPGVSDLKGEFILDADVGGTLGAPELALNLEVVDASMGVPPLGIEVTSLNAKARGDHSAMTMKAQAKLEQGSMNLQVSAENLLNEDWGVSADLSGENAQIFNLPQLSLWLNPDIHVAASKKKIEVRGSANLPKGRALISTLPVSAVKVSNDVVVIDEQQDQPDKIPLHMDLALTLGDDVDVEAAGFKSSLGGKMSLNKTPTRELYAIGDIVVEDGKYEAYGQKLEVERGVISFQGPLDNPGLNITATRRVEDVVVGLIITGTLQYPETEIYSRPPQSESNAMAMLFTGKKLEYASSGEATMLINAVAKLGVKRGQFLADDIAKKFGLDELTIKSEDNVDASQLWLGKYLTKDIYIHYAVGLFDSISTVGLTYFISDNLRIEAESGVVQSADIIYSMER